MHLHLTKLNNTKMEHISKRIMLAIGFAILMSLNIFAQTQYDYYEDSAVYGGAERAFNGLLIFVAIVIALVVIIVVASIILKTYYFINPKADPEYKIAKEREEKEQQRKIEIEEKRKNALPQAIDLGLSVKWASFNVGAYKPSDIGALFYWAENTPSIKGHPKFPKKDPHEFGDINGDTEYDAAATMLGGNWRLPTVKECEELINQCRWEPKTIDGINGYCVTGLNGQSIFLPFNHDLLIDGKWKNAEGHYWTSCPSFRINSKSAQDLRFGGDYDKATIWLGTPDACLYGIRAVYSSKRRDFLKEQIDAINSFSLLENSDKTQVKQFELYDELSFVKENEIIKAPSAFLPDSFNPETTVTDEFGVVYSLDGKRLLDGKNCKSESYEVKEGTEIICKSAFRKGFWNSILNRNKNVKSPQKFILPKSLLFLHKTSLPDNCEIVSKTDNYAIINDMLIDTRKNSVVRCINTFTKEVYIGAPIKEIEDEAFYDCGYLKKVQLPDTILRIGVRSFMDCKLLSEINLPDSIIEISDRAFFGCKELKINHLPQNIEIIGSDAFTWSKFEGVTIPNTVKQIGESPFPRDCKSVTSLSIKYIIRNSLLIDISNDVVIQLLDSSIKELRIPSNIKTIGSSAFSHSNIESVILPDNVIEIESKAFWGCKELVDFHFNDVIARIPDHMFAFCSSLVSIFIPGTIEVIDTHAFYQCKNLTDVYLNVGLKVIEGGAFRKCENLKSITIPQSVERIGHDNMSAFYESPNITSIVYNAKDAVIKRLPISTANYQIGDDVEVIPTNMFYDNPNIKSIVFPKSVRKLSQYCINCCTNLTEITILSQVLEIDEKWVTRCENLRVIRVPRELYDLMSSAFIDNDNVRIKKISRFSFN